MADFYGTGRTNYVKCGDIEKWKSLCNEFGLSMLFNNKDNSVGFTTDNSDLPIFEDENGDERDILNEFSKLLLDNNEVLIFQLIGNEKNRYLAGFSIAINKKGRTEVVSIMDIYDKAKKLGSNITKCEY